MLVIRSNQIVAMRDARLQQLMQADIRNFFAEDCAVLGTATIEKATALAVDRARTYGFTRTEEAVRYIRLIFLLGSYFDEDPLLPWASAILNNQWIVSPVVRMHNLYCTAADFCRRTAGKDGRRYQAALLRIRRTSYEYLSQQRTGVRSVDARTILYTLYPELYRSMSEQTFAALLALGSAKAKAYGLGNGGGYFICLVIMCMVGSNFDRDVLYEWIMPALRATTEPEQKARQLHQIAMDHLDKYRLFNRAAKEDSAQKEN
jgi:hypothetical protein